MKLTIIGGKFNLSRDTAQRMILQWIYHESCVIKREDLKEIKAVQQAFDFESIQMATNYERFLGMKELGSISKSSPLAIFKLAFSVFDAAPLEVLDVDYSQLRTSAYRNNDEFFTGVLSLWKDNISNSQRLSKQIFKHEI
jgi:hypothetical protein